MMNQNKKVDNDIIGTERDYLFNLKLEIEIRNLDKIDLLMMKE